MNYQFIQEFLIDLKFNNNRAWFEENKPRFKKAQKEFANLIDELILLLKDFDDSINIDSSKQAVFRIYRDVRFSKNKEPYKTNFGAFISKDGRKSPYAGYYLHFEPDAYFLGGGIYQPEKEILQAIRQHIFDNPIEFQAIIHDKEFQKYFTLTEEGKLKTSPKGFSKDFENIDLLNYKHYAVTHQLENSFWEQKNPMDEMVKLFKIQSPLNDFLNQIVGDNS